MMMCDHVIVGNGGAVCCTRCGDSWAPKLPLSGDEVTMAGLRASYKMFEEQHTDCEQTPEGRRKAHPETLDEWPTSWDTGLSSMAIYRYMVEGEIDWEGRSVPHDVGDIGRCFRLLDLAPKWRERLPEMAERMPWWSGLVGQWGELRALYDAEKWGELNRAIRQCKAT